MYVHTISQEQYQFCYKAVFEVLESFDHYTTQEWHVNEDYGNKPLTINIIMHSVFIYLQSVGIKQTLNVLYNTFPLIIQVQTHTLDQSYFPMQYYHAIVILNTHFVLMYNMLIMFCTLAVRHWVSVLVLFSIRLSWLDPIVLCNLLYIKVQQNACVCVCVC